MPVVPCGTAGLCGISTGFPMLSPCEGQITHALLARSPLSSVRPFPKIETNEISFDLHVLSTPPAFVLSQDQTLKLNLQPFSRFLVCPVFVKTLFDFVRAIFSLHYGFTILFVVKLSLF